MEGWISVYRQILDNWIWKNNEPFDKRSAWIDLLLIVNYKKEKIDFNGKIIEIERGQSITSIDKLSKRWKWSRHKISNFLNRLEEEGMLVQVRDNKKTLISIENYDKYQFQNKTEIYKKGTLMWTPNRTSKNSTKSIENTKKARRQQNKRTCYWASKGTTQGHYRDTNNNDNNISLFLFNKYKDEFSFLKIREEKQEIFKRCMNEEKYKQMSVEKQTELYTRLMSII